MSKNIPTQAQEARISSRPSLYTGTCKTPENAAAFSILKGVEPHRAERKLRLSVAWTAPLMALAAVGLVAALNNGAGQLSSFAIFPTPETLSKARIESVPVATVAATALEGTEAVAVSAVATIVSEESKPELLSPVITSPDTSAAAGTTAQAPTTTVAPADAGAAPIVAGTKAVLATAAASARNDRGNQGAPSALHERTSIRKGQAAKKTTGKDKDVDLIAALLTHVSSGSKAPSSEGKVKRTATSAAAKTSSPGAGVKREQKTGVNRDVVTAGPAETTESLVKRCRALGFFEGELCRLRICSGMWGKDAACPLSAASQVD